MCREEPVDEAASGDGPAEMDARLAAHAYSRPRSHSTAGAELGEQRVLAASSAELEESKRRGAYAKLLANEASGKTGKKPISARWADVNRGGDRNPEYRSGLVVREAKRSQPGDAFAAAPLLAAETALFSLAASGSAMSGGVRKLRFADVKDARLHAPARGDKRGRLREKMPQRACAAS